MHLWDGRRLMSSSFDAMISPQWQRAVGCVLGRVRGRVSSRAPLRDRIHEATSLAAMNMTD
jgi:hypothetical protein